LEKELLLEPMLHPSWNPLLHEEFSKPYFCDLMSFVEAEYENYVCYPPKDKIFAAFEKCAFDDVKVVILGQDPYHGPDQAHGLCFSVNENVSVPPSLKNIFAELYKDLAKPVPLSGNLDHWASQGVLLLNAVMTVREGQAGSHQNKGWEKFTDAVIKVLSDQKLDVVFLLWGGYARKKGSKINRDKHLVLESGHPSPLSANKGHWFGNCHFSQANSYLKSKEKGEIYW
jgi:uracil-DNA glycosylase